MPADRPRLSLIHIYCGSRFQRRKLKLLHHACNFSSEVISTLLQAFALLEAGKLDVYKRQGPYWSAEQPLPEGG